jgi:hypothetical protein
MRYQPWMRRFDFDAEVAVRLCWRGLRSAQYPGAGALFPPRRGWRLALQLLARQRAADLDAYATFYRVLVAAAVAGVAAPARLKPAHALAIPI